MNTRDMAVRILDADTHGGRGRTSDPERAKREAARERTSAHRPGQ